MWTQGAGREAEPVREGQRKRALFLVYILYAWALACTSCTQSTFGWEEGRNAVHACIFQIATQKLYDCVYTTPKLLILLRLTEAEHYHVYYHSHANITGFSVIFEGCCVVLWMCTQNVWGVFRDIAKSTEMWQAWSACFSCTINSITSYIMDWATFRPDSAFTQSYYLRSITHILCPCKNTHAMYSHRNCLITWCLDNTE